MAIQPPDELLRARRALDELPFYELVDDWTWKESIKKWVLKCRLTVGSAGLVPARTDWYILTDADYPWGEIEFHPAKDGGLHLTFPHQSYNGVGKAELPWRAGKICAQTSMRYAGRRAHDIEPFSITERLRWRVIRSKEWLEAAAAGRVAEKGEPFELPDFPRESLTTLGFIEDEESFRFWQEQPVKHGIATIGQPEGIARWFAVTSFLDARERPVRTVKYGSVLGQRSVRKAQAMWIRLPVIPVLSPWQAPATFGELRAIMSELGVDFDSFVFSLARHFRNGKHHMLLIGFPIPATVGGNAQRYHWQAMNLPILTHNKVNGFRPTEANFAMNDARTVLADGSCIDWITSRNWSEEQIRTRGRASAALTDAKILLIGAGAMGSSIAELLVREGCRRIVAVDGDILELGNLCRHSLSIQHIQIPKAESLAARLNDLSPHVTASGISHKFHECNEAERQQMAGCDIVVDCTGDDRVSHQLSIFAWGGNKLFMSISLGLQAHRLFVYCAHGSCFPHDDFAEKLSFWLNKELQEHRGFVLPREGAGCWSPVFPARSDDVWLMSSVAVKCMDAWATTPPHAPCLNVYAQEQNDGFPAGVTLVGRS